MPRKSLHHCDTGFGQWIAAVQKDRLRAREKEEKKGGEDEKRGRGVRGRRAAHLDGWSKRSERHGRKCAQNAGKTGQEQEEERVKEKKALKWRRRRIQPQK